MKKETQILTLSNNLAVVLGAVHSTSCFLARSSKNLRDSERHRFVQK